MADISSNSSFDASYGQSFGDEGEDGTLPALRPADYKVGWICALPIELAASRAMLDGLHRDLSTDALDTNNYVLGNIGQHNIVMACLGEYGTNNAAHVAAHMTRSFPSIRVRLMVGIGGGVPARDIDLRLGDIVVGRRVMQYDLGKIVSSGEFERKVVLSSLRPELGAAISKLRAIHESSPTRVPFLVSEMVQKNPEMRDYSGSSSLPDWLFVAEYEHDSKLNYCDDCDPDKIVKRAERENTQPKIHYGGIASANQVIKHGVTRDTIANELDIICFEMEAAGLMDHFPCLVVRGICDYSDSHKNKKWQRCAAANAAGYAKELLMTMALESGRQMTLRQSSNPDQRISDANRKQRRRKLMESLPFEQMYWRQSNIKSAHPVTCEWLLEHPSYLIWRDNEKIIQHHGFMWISGKPGSGKSTLMKYLLSQQQNKARTEGSAVAISFFFHARGEELEKTTFGMYKSLVFQLLDTLPDLQVVLDDLSLIPQMQEPCPTLEVLKELFRRAVSLLGKRSLVCYVDALDECDEDEVRDMIENFEDLCENIVKESIDFKICLSSRHYPYIYLQHGIRLVLENQTGHKDDLKRYIRSRLKTGRGPENEAIHEEIFQKAAGIFMWVVLVVEILNKEFQRGRFFAVRKKLGQIPRRLSDIFRDVCIRESENREELTLSLQWILFAKRPLKAKELYYGVSIGLLDDCCEDILDNDIDQATAEAFVMSSSRGLAEITKGEDSRVQFIHESVRDFLIKEDGLSDLIPNLDVDTISFSNDRIKECCGTYISGIKGMNLSEERPLMSTLCSKPMSWHTLRGEVTARFPLAEYASLFVLSHAEESAMNVPQEAFLRNFRVSDWIPISNLYRNYEHRYPSDESLVDILLDQKYLNLLRITCKINIHESGGYINLDLLSSSLDNGDWDAARAVFGLNKIKPRELVLPKHGRDLSISLIHNETIQSPANKNNMIIQHSSSRELSSRGSLSIEPPSLGFYAIENGFADLLEWLIEHGLSTARDHDEDWASTFDHIKGSYFGKMSRRGLMKTSYLFTKALRNGFSDIAILLLENAIPWMFSDTGSSGLEPGGIRTLADLLLRNGVKSENIFFRRFFKLERIESEVRIQLLKLSFDRKISFNMSAPDYYSLLKFSAASADGSLAKHLLERSTEPARSELEISRIPVNALFFRAIIRHDNDLLRLFIRVGFDLEARDANGHSALSSAIKNYNREAVEILMKAGADSQGQRLEEIQKQMDNPDEIYGYSSSE